MMTLITGYFDLYSTQLIAGLQASFCGGCAYLIAFKYKRGNSSYYFLPSLCAFGLACLMAQQWLSIMVRALLGDWPEVSPYNTMVFAIMFILLNRSRGNVSRMFDFNEDRGASA